MKHATKSIIAITTLINGRINYISAHSVRENGSLLPQFDLDAQKAKEFDSMSAANEYLKKVFNPFHRLFTVIHIDILDIVESKHPFINFDRSIKKLASIIIIVLVTLTSCSTYTCPSINGGREPKDKTKRMTVSYKTLKDGKYLVTERKGFNTSQYITDCKPCK